MSTLPTLNSDYKYEMTLPVTKTKHRFRPYLVKEEKALLMANESEDKKQMAIAMRDTLESCVEGVEIDLLPLADMEYAFAQVRARSAGEVVNITVECEHCTAKHKAAINLLDATATETEFENEHSIELQPNWILDLRWPTLASAINSPDTDSEVEQAFGLIRQMLVSLRTPDGMWDFGDVSEEEAQKFLDGMNGDQMSDIRNYLQDMPQCKIDLDFICPSCGTENHTSLLGTESFFG